MVEHQDHQEELRKLQDAEIEATLDAASCALEYVYAHLERIADEAIHCPSANELLGAVNRYNQAQNALFEAEEPAAAELEAAELARFDAIVREVEIDAAEDAAAAEEIDARHARRLREIEERQS